jgi:hypothetical protein
MASLTVELPEKLARRLADEARSLNISEQVRVVKLLEQYVAPRELLNPRTIERGLPKLVEFLNRIPAVTVISSSKPSEPQWWVKVNIDIEAEVAWKVVQELGFVLNYISLRERLATVFMPVSPPPYLNGGPKEYLSWAIEAAIPFVDPATIAAQLEASLPNPVDDLNQWLEENEDGDSES